MVEWMDIEQGVNNLYNLMHEALNHNWDSEYKKALFRSYHKMIDIKEQMDGL